MEGLSEWRECVLERKKTFRVVDKGVFWEGEGISEGGWLEGRAGHRGLFAMRCDAMSLESNEGQVDSMGFLGDGGGEGGRAQGILRRGFSGARCDAMSLSGNVDVLGLLCGREREGKEKAAGQSSTALAWKLLWRQALAGGIGLKEGVFSEQGRRCLPGREVISRGGDVGRANFYGVRGTGYEEGEVRG